MEEPHQDPRPVTQDPLQPAVVAEHLARRFGPRQVLTDVSFSVGGRRRWARASARVHEPDALLLDDPVRGLEGYARLEQLEVLRELRRLGSTIVLAGTRPEDLLEVCDAVSVLRS